MSGYLRTKSQRKQFIRNVAIGLVLVVELVALGLWLCNPDTLSHASFGNGGVFVSIVAFADALAALFIAIAAILYLADTTMKCIAAWVQRGE